MTMTPVPKAQSGDLIGQIVHSIRSMGLAPIPRNYQLFYEASLGSNPDLTRDLAALGSRATQEELDALAHRYLGSGRQTVIEDAHARIVSELDLLLKLLHQEQNSLENYDKLLGETARQINSRQNFSAEILRNAVLLLTEATRSTMAHGEKTAGGVAQRSREMDQVRSELDEYKRIANTDSLTQIANRRAFDERLAAIYDNPALLPVIGLVLADIDHFKKINDSFGHPVGDRVLATVATLIRTHVRKDVFVARSGGEEFALIVEGNTPDEIMSMCERVRRTLETCSFRNSRSGVDYGPVTMSIGFAMASQAGTPGELYANADLALYHAKKAGRNRTIAFDDGMNRTYAGNHAGKGWLLYKKEP